MNLIKTILSVGFFTSFLVCLMAQPAKPKQLTSSQKAFNTEVKKAPSVAEMILSYVVDYRSDRFAADPIMFGIVIPDNGEWTVNITGKETTTGWEVTLLEGLPKLPTFIYQIEYETLVGIYEGKLNALTAQGKAFSGDYTPMYIQEMEGYISTPEENGKINALSFHFFTKGFPEIIPFGEGMTRRAHGSNFVIFYYQPGLRTAWYRVLPNERVREDPREQAMPFPMLIVAIKGTTKGEVDGQAVSLSEGNTIFIPPFATHKWWNETEDATEAILIMFGDGA